MNKKLKKWIWIILIIIILFLGIELFFGFPLGVECGYWSFFAGYEKSCDCIGIKTGHCGLGSVCDGGTYGCIGVCSNCVCRQLNATSGNREVVSCD